jgi:hypothetical protein
MIPNVAGGLAGQRLGDYELTALLGAGGMAEVYRALDVDMDRTVAVKVLPAALSADPGYAARFRAAVRRVAALDHPHIVPIDHYGEERGLLYLVMPILKESLRDRLEREQIPLADATRYATEIAAGLDMAHAQGIVHRAIKPENILLDEAGAALLTDFAIARESPTAPANGRKTPALSPIHTLLDGVAYMAPEQLRQMSVDRRADVYALGAVLYELLTGVAPHAAPTPYEVAAKALTQPITPPSARNPAVRPELERVVLTALAADPTARYQDMRAFTLALRHALAQQPAVATHEAPAPPMPAAALAGIDEAAQLTSSARLTPRLASASAVATLPPKPAVTARPARAWHARPRFLPRFLPGSVSEAGFAFAALIAVLLVAHLALGTPMPGVFVGSTDGLGAFGVGQTGQTATGASASPTKTSGGSQGSGTTSSGSTSNPTGASGSTPSGGSDTLPSGTPTSGGGATATPSSGSTPGGSGGGSGGSPGGPPSSTPTPNPASQPPSLAFSPSAFQLAPISTSGGSGGTCAATQTITNTGANAATWQWGALPVSMHFTLNGQPAPGSWPNGTLGSGASTTLRIIFGCNDLKSTTTATVAVTDTSTGGSRTYSISISPPA